MPQLTTARFVGGGSPLCEPLAGVLGRYSNYGRDLRRCLERVDLGRARGRSTDDTARSWRPHRVIDRLSPDELGAMVTAFQNGVPVSKLAKRYKLGETAIREQLHMGGAGLRAVRRLTAEDVAAARTLREQGQSYGAIAAHLGVTRQAIARWMR